MTPSKKRRATPSKRQAKKSKNNTAEEVDSHAKFLESPQGKKFLLEHGYSKKDEEGNPPPSNSGT